MVKVKGFHKKCETVVDVLQFSRFPYFCPGVQTESFESQLEEME